MELIYIWIEDYKIINKQGFNFSSNWRIGYNNTNNNLSIAKKDPLPNNFFGSNIVNVSAVVGENGAGKSTLFEFLLSYYFTPHNYIDYDVIAVWYFDDNDGEPSIGIHRSNLIGDKEFSFPTVKGFKIYDEVYDPEKELNEWQFHKRTRHPFARGEKVFYSNSLDQRYFQFRGINLSSLYLMRGGELNPDQADELLIESSTKNYFAVHFIKDFKRQLDYISSNPDIPFETPQSIYLNPSQLNLLDLSAFKLDQKVLDQIRHFRFLLEFDPNFKVAPERKTIAADFYDSLFSYSLKRYITNGNKNGDLDVNKFLAPYLDKDTNKVEIILDKFSKEEVIFINEIYKFTQTLKLFSPHNNNRGENSWIIEKDKWEELYTLINENSKLFIDCFMFSWDLPSAGELAFLKLFARLFSIRNKLNKYGNSVYLFLDEAETGFHPQWQKKYFKYILDFVNKTFERKFQIFITTHSPFLVSDLPSGNVVFLKKEDERCKVINEEEEIPMTFGANIHVLLSDSFFLQGGLIGEFANTKIQEVITWINDDNEPDENEKNEKLSLIEKIGEPLIRIKLLEMYQEKFGISGEIRNLAEQIRILEEKKRNLENQ